MVTSMPEAAAVPTRRRSRVAVARQRRTAAVYLAIWVAGLLPVVAGMAPGWQAVGLGLWFPGAGFLVCGPWGIVWALLTLLLFAVAFVAWFAAALLVAPLAVWLASVVLAALVAAAPTWNAAPYLGAAVVASTLIAGRWSAARRRARDVAVGATRDAALPGALERLRGRRVEVPRPDARELDERQLQHLRYLLDRSLQPVGSFDGFDRIDQFQGAALRYQLNFTGYSLALTQRHYTPNFHGYLSTAQRNVIDKYTDHRVWSYWIWESIGGHLNFRNFDPVGRDNIMLSGFFAMQVGMYMATTGDHRYLQPDSITFRKRDGSPAYPHGYPDLIDSITGNQDASPYCLYPCEPNWIYSICNHMGMTSLAVDDRLRGRDRVQQVLPRWLAMLDNEMSDGKGSPVALRSKLTGFPLPFPTPDSMFVTFSNCFIPDRAERIWAIARTELDKHLVHGEDGTHLELPGTVVDFGHYRQGYVWILGQIANAAHEMGDEEFAAIAERTMDRDGGLEITGGVARYRRASNAGNCYAILARLQRRDDFRNLACAAPPPGALTGPILAEADYPQVLVARAYSTGEDLRLVLHPGAEPGSAQRLGLARLRPGRRYRVEGAPGTEVLSADPDGRAWLDVALNGRVELSVTPTG